MGFITQSISNFRATSRNQSPKWSLQLSLCRRKGFTALDSYGFLLDFFSPGHKRSPNFRNAPLAARVFLFQRRKCNMFIMKCLLGTWRKIVQLLKLVSNVWLEWRNTKDTKREKAFKLHVKQSCGGLQMSFQKAVRMEIDERLPKSNCHYPLVYASQQTCMYIYIHTLHCSTLHYITHHIISNHIHI